MHHIDFSLTPLSLNASVLQLLKNYNYCLCVTPSAQASTKTKVLLKFSFLCMSFLMGERRELFVPLLHICVAYRSFAHDATLSIWMPNLYKCSNNVNDKMLKY